MPYFYKNNQEQTKTSQQSTSLNMPYAFGKFKAFSKELEKYTNQAVKKVFFP